MKNTIYFCIIKYNFKGLKGVSGEKGFPGGIGIMGEPGVMGEPGPIGEKVSYRAMKFNYSIILIFIHFLIWNLTS